MNGRLLALLACFVVPCSAPAAQCVRGALVGEVTYVRDGDTIELGSTAIRLEGIAAPEWDEPGGSEAREAMIELAQGRKVRRELTGKRTYDRCVAVCYLDGADVEAIMVRDGFAGTVRASAAGAMPRQSAKLPPMPRRSARFIPCRGTAAGADAVAMKHVPHPP